VLIYRERNAVNVGLFLLLIVLVELGELLGELDAAGRGVVLARRKEVVFVVLVVFVLV